MEVDGMGQVYDPNLPNQPWTAKCVCLKVFMQPNSYALHIKCCLKFKQSLGRQLRNARQKRKDWLEQNQAGDRKDQGALSCAAEGQLGLGKLGKRKPEWINDSNLEVDVVLSQTANVSGSICNCSEKMISWAERLDRATNVPPARLIIWQISM